VTYNRITAPTIVLSLLTGACTPPSGTPPEHRTAEAHPIQYFVSLPAGWTKDRSWPVVVSIPGSGKEFEQNAKDFAAERDRKQYPFITVTPMFVTNGGRDQRNSARYSYSSEVWDRVAKQGYCQFDFDAFRALVADVAKNFNGETRVFMTGFSGGGQFAIAKAFLHPDDLRAAAIAASNYNGRCITVPTEAPSDTLPPQTFPTGAEHLALPIRFFNGTDDPFNKYLLPQRDTAMGVAKSHGFQNVSSEMIGGAVHQPMVRQALAYFASLRNENAR
jgi:poly(3-hydroxybutyrate) depolymerase